MNLTQKSDRKPKECRALRGVFSPFKGISPPGWYKDTRGRIHERIRGRTHVSES